MSIKRFDKFNEDFNLSDLTKDEKEALSQGKLGDYLKEHGREITFGMLKAIFDDAIKFNKNRKIGLGAVKMTHRLIPMAMATVYPLASIVGMMLGSTRALDKILVPIVSDPGKNYPEFLKKFIKTTTNIVEGDIKPLVSNKFYKAFVVSDGISKMLDKNVLDSFARELSDKMSLENESTPVPDNYIENELKHYINVNYQIDPPILLKPGHIPI